MPTKLSRFCDGVIEAGWLAAVIVVPLFFNTLSSRIFEPDKLALLRSIALLVLGAWLVKTLAEGGIRWERPPEGESRFRAFWHTPFVLPVVGLVIVYVLSTLLSITPRISLMGGYQRMQGLYTTFSYLVIFGAMAINLRKKAQISRLLNTIVLTSLPVSLYGILQRYRIDPVPWAGDVVNRVASNMGNAIFVAAYLIMASPFTILCIITAFRAILQEKEGLWVRVAQATAYVFVFILQVIALYLSGSRGPWLGWFAGLFFLFVLLTLYWRKRRLMLGVMAVALILGVFLLMLNLPQGPLQGLRNHPAFGRIGHLLEAEADSTGRVRVLIWEGVADLMTPHAPLTFPDGHQDPFNFLRPLVGYGPESLYVTFNRFYPPELGQIEKRNASPDRSHNEIWDVLATTGILGLAVHLFLFVSVFYYSLKWLGLIHSARQRWLFFAFYFGGALIGAVLLVAWRGRGYLGVGLPLGIVFGMIAYLTVEALMGLEAGWSDRHGYSFLLLAPLAAVLAHLVEVTFGISIAATNTYFWVSLGLLFVAGYAMPRLASERVPAVALEPSSINAGESPARRKTRRPERSRRAEKGGQFWLTEQLSWVRHGLVAMFLALLVFTTLGFGFIINNPTNRQTTTLGVLTMVLTRLPNRGNALSFGILALLITTWLAACVLLVHHQADGDPRQWLKAFGLAAVGTAVFGAFYWLIEAGGLATIASMTLNNVYDLYSQLNRAAGLLSTYYLALFVFGVGLAAALPDEWPPRGRSSLGLEPLVGLVVLGAVFVGAYTTNVRPIQANMVFKFGEPLSGEQWPVASVIFKRTIEMAPKEDFYYLYLGRSYLEQAKNAQDPAEQQKFVEDAVAVLLEARALNPLNTDHSSNLARLYSWWAGVTQDDVTQAQRGQQSADYYATALMLSPNHATLWSEWGSLLLNLGQLDAAYQKIDRALNLDPTYAIAHALAADYYTRLSQTMKEPALITDTLRLAAQQYGLAAESKTDNTSRVNYYIAQGNTYLQIGDLSAAAQSFENTIPLKPKADDLWRIEKTIAQIYLQAADKSSALRHAQSALEAAPEEQKSGVLALIDQIQALP